jgi:hypothetical protein
MADRYFLDLELSDESKAEIRELIVRTCEEAAAEFTQGFEARIRKIVFDAMRERDLRVAQK